MKLLLLLSLLGCLAPIASCIDRVVWCVTSAAEERKCQALRAVAPVFTCQLKASIVDCLIAIQAREADAITLDGGEIYTAGMDNYKLHPIIAEQYGSITETCYYAVAVAKKGTKFGFHQLAGKKSCHTGVGKSAGWNIPIGTLLSMDFIKWKGSDDKKLEEVVGEFFHSSCAPGATESKKLCDLCREDCSKTEREPYYNYHGAFQCLKDGAGEVAFVKHLTVPEAERGEYELLCRDNTRKTLQEYETCHLAKVPSHAVVTRSGDKDLAKFIWESLSSVQGFNLFESATYGGKNLMFKDSATALVQLPMDVDHTMYLGPAYLESIKALKKVNIPSTSSDAMKWCAVGPESTKCDSWGDASLTKDGTVIDCIKGTTVEDCLKKIMHKEADAMSVDGGEVYTAGKCGLVPAMVEQYDQGQCNAPGATGSYYYAVAVVKKGSVQRWEDLKGKRSCHTGVGRNAGWNVPMGILYNNTNICNFTSYFSSGCAPGADLSSPLCAQCAGNEESINKCKASSEERYYGYAGAFRCMASGAGDVAFVKHSIIGENTDGKGPEWAKGFKSTDYQLICPDKSPVAVTDFLSCNLAKVTAHAVVTRPEMRSKVVSFLKTQQGYFGTGATDDLFKMFQSTDGSNLLFKDSTKCLQEVPAELDYIGFLGPEYIKVVSSLRTCKESISALDKICSYSMCKS